jgi:hypothetical protein
MNPVNFFKLQAKHLLQDYRTQYLNTEYKDFPIYSYKPKYINISSIVDTVDYDEVHAAEFTLMKAQHLLSWLLGFKCWADLLKAPIDQQELLVHLFKHNICAEEWYSQGLSYREQLGLLEYYLENGAYLHCVDYLKQEF